MSRSDKPTRDPRPRITGAEPDRLQRAALHYLCVVSGRSVDSAAAVFGAGFFDLSQPEAAWLIGRLRGSGYDVPEAPQVVLEAAMAAHDAGHPDIRIYLAHWLARLAGHLAQGLTRDRAEAAATTAVVEAAKAYCEQSRQLAA